jgi:DNA-binding GntR family transcriptional regulator
MLIRLRRRRWILLLPTAPACRLMRVDAATARWPEKCDRSSTPSDARFGAGIIEGVFIGACISPRLYIIVGTFVMTSISPDTEIRVTPVQAPTLKGRIASEIRGAILRGDLKPGNRIVESRLAKQINVAQTTVREALQELETEGLVVKIINRETQVRKLTKADLVKLFQVRLELEGLAAELARANASPHDFEELEQAVDGMRRAARRGDVTGFYRADMEFHRRMWATTRNEFLIRALEPLSIGPFAFVLAGAPLPETEDFEAVVDDHMQIIDVLRADSPKAARRLMEEKLRAWQEIQMRNLSSFLT